MKLCESSVESFEIEGKKEMNKLRVLAVVGTVAMCVGGAAAATCVTNLSMAGFTIPDETKWTYEPKVPLLKQDKDGVVRGLNPGFHGRNAGLERINGANAIGNENAKAWSSVAWRNEKVHGQFVVWSQEGVRRLRASVSPLVSAEGNVLPQEAVTTRFVRHVVGHSVRKGRITSREDLYGDCLDDVEQLDLPPCGYRPVWLTVSVPVDARPGVYKGVLALRAGAALKLDFPLELTVRSHTLPSPSQWRLFVDLWQHPWAVARYHGVKPFSELHYNLMGMYLREVASLGQKTITATIVDDPWGQGNNYDLFHSMVEVTRRKDGTWSYDYSEFDRYVTFAKECGLGPQIHCYTLAGFKTSYTDEATGERLLSISDSNKSREYWVRFLKDFESHVKAKGWLGDVYVALDESHPDVLRSSAELLRSAAPGLKLAMAGNRKPSEYKGVDIDNFSLHYSCITPEFLDEAKIRRAKGLTTSCYVCGGRPCTQLTRPLYENTWIGIFAVASGLDGILRWAAFTWPRDPLFDGSFIQWPPGGTYLLYPGPRSSMRWEMLRDGIEIAEKIRILREQGKSTPELERLLEPAAFKRETQFFSERVSAVRAAVDAL